MAVSKFILAQRGDNISTNSLISFKRMIEEQESYLDTNFNLNASGFGTKVNLQDPTGKIRKPLSRGAQIAKKQAKELALKKAVAKYIKDENDEDKDNYGEDLDEWLKDFGL